MRFCLAAGVVAFAALFAASAQGSTRSDAAAAPGLPTVSAPADMIVGEADGVVDLVVKLSQASASPVTVHYTTNNGSAAWVSNACNSDFIGASDTILTFAANQTTADVPISILDCPNVEGFESFTLDLSSPTGATIARASTRVGIVDNDNVVATPRLFVRNAIVDEADGVAHVPVLMGGPGGQASNSDVTVDYATSDGTATAGGDYTAKTGTLSFHPGHTVNTIDVPITNDGSPERAETFTVTLSNPSAGVAIGDGTGTVLIGASDGDATSLPNVSAAPDTIVGEGDGYVDLSVSLSAPSINPVTVLYTTTNSSAAWVSNACNSDFLGTSGTLNFAPGETTKVVRVDIFDCTDPTLEGFQSFTFDLSLPPGTPTATLARASTRIGIVDNDNLVASPRLFVRNAIVDERDGFARVPVLLGGTAGEASTSAVTVSYATSDHSANAGTDYTAVSGTLTFWPGQTAKTIVIPIADDGVAEAPEDFSVTLSNPTNASLGDSTGVVVIGGSAAGASSLPDISAPPNALVGEKDGFVDLVVTLAEPGVNPVSVHYATTNGSAAWVSNACNSDYLGTSGTLDFAPGETTKVVRVDILDCALVEPLEFFTFSLDTPLGGALVRSTTRIDIVDNDVAPTLDSITVTPASPTTSVGGDVQFLATGNYSNGSSPDLTSQVAWTSSVTATATIGANGLAHPVFPGATTITATAPLILALGPLTGATALTVDRQQTITFTQPPTKTYGDADFTVNPTASSGLAVGLGAAGNCTLNGATVHITGAGSCTITATQPGNANFDPAPDAVRTFTIVKANQTIAFGALAGKTVTDADFAVSATATSGLPVSFTAAVGGPCTVSGTTVHLTAAGTCTITAKQDGNVDFNAAPSVPQSFAIGKGNQTIAFGTLPTKTYGEADFTIAAAASSGLPVSFSASGSCTVTGTTVHVFAAGSCTIAASQSGNSSFNAAPGVQQTFSIAKASQAITVNTHAPSTTSGGASFPVSATAPGGSVTYSSSGACTNSGSFFTTSSAGGTCTVAYDQPGNANYNAAPEVTEAVVVSASATTQKQNQTITFAALPNKSDGDPDFSIGATASSGLAVSFSASGQCTVSGTTVHLTGPGACTITASQAGNASFNAAAPVSRSFTIAAVQPSPPPATCKTPRLSGKTLTAAKSAIASAHCSLGNVTYTYSSKKKGTVVSQSRDRDFINIVLSSGPVPPALADAVITGRCNRISARLLLAHYRLGDLGDPKLRDPVSQVLCGAFAGKHSRAMAVTLAIPACGRTGGWVVFRWNGRAWKVLLRQMHGADLAAVGTTIRETMFVFRSRDTHCNPTGGTRSRLWHWNGRRLVGGAWKRAR